MSKNLNIIEQRTNSNYLEGFIYVPSIGLYAAKEKSLHNLNWYDAHKALHEQDLQMLTIKQFVEFIKYLKQNKRNIQESESILDEILTTRNPWRSEWLDAKFEDKNNQSYINYNHRTINGELQPQVIEPLEQCLMKDKIPGINLEYWLNNATSQGLPPKNNPKGDLHYWCPINEYVARFGADSDGAVLYCFRLPQYSYSALGVRAAKKIIPKEQN